MSGKTLALFFAGWTVLSVLVGMAAGRVIASRASGEGDDSDEAGA